MEWPVGWRRFVLVSSAKQQTTTAINGSGAAPLAASIDRYLAEGRIPESGWLAATVPGLVDAWRVALERHGTMSLGVLLEDAIHYAERGFPLTARQARHNREMEPTAAAFGETVAIFFPDGHPPPAVTSCASPTSPGRCGRYRQTGRAPFSMVRSPRRSWPLQPGPAASSRLAISPTMARKSSSRSRRPTADGRCSSSLPSPRA